MGFEVEPFSVKHKYDGKWNADRPELKTCNSNSMKFVSEKDIKQEVKEGEEIVFTYDVTFKVRQPLPDALAFLCTSYKVWTFQRSQMLCRHREGPICTLLSVYVLGCAQREAKLHWVISCWQAVTPVFICICIFSQMQTGM